jgi:hypothetical protein
MRDSAKTTPDSRTRVPPDAASTPGANGRPPSISASARGPGCGSIGRRSQVTPPTTGSAPWTRQASAVASAPTTSPPPPIPSTSGRRERDRSWSASIM